MLYGGDVDMIPGRPAEVSDYQRTADGRLWWVDGGAGALNELREARDDLEVVENIGLEVPQPSSVELMAGGIGDTGSRYHLKLLGVDSSLRSQVDGSDVRVAIIDSGLYKDHSEFERTSILKDCAWDYWHIRPTSGKVTYIDLPPGKKYEPRNYHGTAVAGMLCGASLGVAPGVALMIHNVFYQQTAADEAKALRWKEKGRWHEPETDLIRVEWAIDKAVAQKADIILLSLGRTGYNDCFNQELINQSNVQRLIVAAIGNDGPRTHCSPGDYEYVLSVGATDPNDEVWLNPETGKGTAGDLIPKGNTSYRVPVIYAPGANLILPVPEHIDQSSYITRSGTSFAAPLVAGVAALIIGWYKERGKEIRANEVKQLLLETADDIPLPNELGGGTGKRVNAAKAVETLKARFPVS
jgi:subtilisin family serine protease